MSDARLQLVLQGEPGATLPLPTRGRLVLGSSAERATFVVEGQGIDDAHCAIGHLRSGGWAIKDLGSNYGTLVNGKRTETARLAEGDVIVIGSRRLLVSASGEETPRPSPPADGAPQRVPGFRLERRLGSGGMGEVHLALQESLGRHVAIKILSKRLTEDRDFVLRFHREARAAAALSHPNVVVVHDVGETGGRHYLVMEYMPGGSLEDRLAQHGRLPWRDVLSVLHDAASGLTYAEEQGIVHRDIKPDNLMIAASGAVKIADLGLATPVADPAADENATPDGRNFGTPHFLSPEQARGLPLDHRSDLYSLGATAYRLLTGKTPFHGATAREIIRARFTSTPLPPREHVAEIPVELESLVLRCMALEPGDRPASAQELLHEVDRMRLEAEHGPAQLEAKPSRSFLRVLVAMAVPLAILGLWRVFFPGGPKSDAPQENGAELPIASPFEDPGQAVGPGMDPDEEDFFGDPARETLDPDEERELRAMELEAELARRRVPAGEGRIAALEQLIEDFAPTRVASEARDEVARLRQAELDERVARARSQLEADEALERLRTGAGWPPRGEALPRIGDFLRRIERYQVSVALASSPLYVAGRQALVDEVLSTGLERVRASLGQAEQMMERGAFEDVSALYAELGKCLELPPVTDDDPAALGELRELAQIVADRSARFGEDAATYGERIAAADRARIASAFGPGSGFHRELADLRLELAHERASGLLPSLQTPEARARAERLAARFEEARSALGLLAETLKAGTWRRKTTTVPGGRRAVSLDVAGIQADGVVVTGEDGPETVAWSRFSAQPGALHQLFRNRLSRDYTDEEKRAILALLSLAAAQRAATPAEAVLDTGTRALLEPADVKAMGASFEPVRAWMESVDEAALGSAAVEARAEEEAAQLLLGALEAAQEGAWSVAVANIERLLEAYADSLVVLILSDGRSLEPRRPGRLPSGPRKADPSGG